VLIVQNMSTEEMERAKAKMSTREHNGHWRIFQTRLDDTL